MTARNPAVIVALHDGFYGWEPAPANPTAPSSRSWPPSSHPASA